MSAPLSSKSGNIYRYGMLVVILGLAISAIASLYASRGEGATPYMLLVVVAILLMNHVIAEFLTPEQQKRVRIPQWIILAVALSLVTMQLFRGMAHRDAAVKWTALSFFVVLLLVPFVFALAIRRRKKTNTG